MGLMGRGSRRKRRVEPLRGFVEQGADTIGHGLASPQPGTGVSVPLFCESGESDDLDLLLVRHSPSAPDAMTKPSICNVVLVAC